MIGIRTKSVIFGLMLVFASVTCALGSSILVSDKLVDPGDTAVLVTVTLSNTVPYAGSEFELHYNSSLLDLNRIEPTSRLSSQSGTGFYEFSTGKLSVVVFDYDGENLEADSATIFDVYFDISPDSAEGQAEISIPEVTAVSDNLQFDSVTVKNGFICIGAVSGDSNDDKKVDIADIVYVINYLLRSGPSPVPIPLVADVNCDQKADIVDAVYLINYILKSGPAPNDPDDDGIPDC